MRLLATSAIALMLASTAVYAADAPDLLVDEDPIALASDWNGLYIGAGVTGLLASTPETIGEVQGVIGFNVQSDSFLFGAEAYAAYGWSSLGTQFWELGGEARAGYVIDQAVLYGSLGGVYVGPGGATYLTAGGGVEFMLADNMSLDLEYRHYFPVSAVVTADSITAQILWHIQ